MTLGGFQWHNVHKKFNKNQSIGSKVEWGKTRARMHTAW
jgi:hypothetical protein